MREQLDGYRVSMRVASAVRREDENVFPSFLSFSLHPSLGRRHERGERKCPRDNDSSSVRSIQDPTYSTDVDDWYFRG